MEVRRREKKSDYFDTSFVQQEASSDIRFNSNSK